MSIMEKTGTVTMTLEAYNDLIKELTMYRNAITVKESGWRNQVDMHVDMSMFYNAAEALVAEDYPDATMLPKREVYSQSTAIATLPQEEDDAPAL